MLKPSSPSLRPTRLGVAFLGLVVLTLIGCINYGLSLGYGLTFLLGGVWVITAAQAARALRTLGLSLLPPAEAVAGHPTTFSAQVHQEGPASNVLIRAQVQQSRRLRPVQASAGVGPGGMTLLALTDPAPLRGPLHLKGVRLVSVDAFGFWHASRAVDAEASVLVSPSPEVDAPPPPTLSAAGNGESGLRVAGHDEFAGVRPYLAGDSPRLISWKHVARTGALMTREFDAPAGQALDLNWPATSGAGDQEKRLSRLAAWVATARTHALPLALRLPGFTLPLGSGEGHYRAALVALAGFTPLPTPSAPAKTTDLLAWPTGLGNRGQTPTPPPLPAAPLQFSVLALGFALLPGLLHYPLWTCALIAALLVYTVLAPQRRWPPLLTWALLGLAVLAGALLNMQFGTLLGAEAGTAILATLLALKVAETRTVRDAKLLSLLGLFLNSTHYFHNQGPLTALHSVLAAVGLLAAASGWMHPYTPSPDQGNNPGKVKGNGEVSLQRGWLRETGRLLLLSLPLATALFMLFPRPDGPLWQLPMQGQAQTGLADEVNAGAFSNLARNDAVAFRADFAGGALPPPEQRYWRGPVYEAYDGVKWTQVRGMVRFAYPSVEFARGAPRYQYSLTLEPSGKYWLLALDTPFNLPQNTLLTSAFQAVTFRPASVRTRYLFQSGVARLGRQESANRLNLNLDLNVPAGQNPRARALAEGWRSFPPEKRVQAALDYFAKQGFAYTLEPPALPENHRIDAFLFGSKRGFCEHYASAFGFLLRAAGVPTRLVGGYQGGEVNPNGGYLIVRQQDAHAWNEVWLEGQGWVRVDPTAVVAPARINANLGTALTQPQASVPRQRAPWQQLRLRIDAFQNQWNNWVVAYDGQQQRSFLNRLGIGGVGTPTYLLALLGVAALLLWPVLWWVRRNSRPKDPAMAALYELSERLGLPRWPGETASAYAERAAQRYPVQEARLQEIASLFNRIRYAPDDSRAAQLKALREQLREVRRK